MKFFILTGLLSGLLWAQEAVHPKVYESLGNEIYSNAAHIEKLKTLDLYTQYTNTIDTYISDVNKTKILGYQVESGNRKNIKLEYLNQLRKHKKVNDYFIRSAQSAFKSALDSKDNILFVGIVNSGLLDTSKNRKAIMNYYKMHKKDMNPQGIMQIFLDEEEASKNKKYFKSKTKKQIQEEKIARLRKNDILDKAALEKKLSDALKAEKAEIRKEQERELFN